MRRSVIAAGCILTAFALALLLSGLGNSTGRPVADNADSARARVEVECTGRGVPKPDALYDLGGNRQVRLLVERTMVRPGETFAVAPLNETSAPIEYGLRTLVVDAETGKRLPGPGSGAVLAIALGASAGEPGPCAAISIPNTAPPGDYLAVLDDVSGSDFEQTDVSAPFTIAGQPIHDDQFAPAGVTPANSPAKILYEPDGEPLNARRLNPAKVGQTVSEATGKQIAGRAIESRFQPDGVRIVLVGGGEGDVPPALNALRREEIDVNRVILATSPFTAEEVKDAANRVSRVLRDEPARSWGVSYDETEGTIGVNATELTLAGFNEIQRVAGVPVRFVIASGE